MTGNWDLDALVTPERVHRSIYVEPEIFAEEMRRVFGGTWVYLAHESQIPEPHDFTTSVIGMRPLIVTRDGDGTVHALVNRCAHRASTVCQEECGNAKRFTCGYHGWTYANDGDLVGLPYPKGYPESFDRSTHGLKQLPRVASYRGFVFGSLNPDVAPIEDWLGPAIPYLDYFIDRSPGGVQVGNGQRMTFTGNWKLAWDNAGDGLHPTFSHRSFPLLNAARHGPNNSLSQFANDPDGFGMFGEYLGHGHIFVDQRPGLSGSFWETQRPVPGREAAAGAVEAEFGAEQALELLEQAPGSMINLTIFPNLLIFGNQISVLEPRGLDRTDFHLFPLTAASVPGEINTVRMRVAEDFITLGTPDDFEIFRRCWEGLQVPEVEWIDSSKGLGFEVIETRDGVEVRRGEVTHDTTLRGYLREWKRLMQTDMKLTLV